MEELERGRGAYAEHAWLNAFNSLAGADGKAALDVEDLERLGRSAYMLGRDHEYVAALERAHRLCLERNDIPRAVGCGFWIGHSFLFRGERARAVGWFARSGRQAAPGRSAV